MSNLLKKGDQILVSTEVPGLNEFGDILMRAVVTAVIQQQGRFSCRALSQAPPYDSGRTISLQFENEGVTWARGWDRESKRAFRAMLMLKAAS